MTPERRVFLRLLAVLAILLPLISMPASADDEDEEATVERIEWQIQVGTWPPPPAVPAPSLFVPADGEFEGQPHMPFLPMESRDRPIVFGEARMRGYVPSIEVILDLLMSTPLGVLLDEGELAVEARHPRTLLFRGSPASIRRAKQTLQWLTEAALPNLEVRAALTSGGDDPALLATGAARLEPGVWTGLYEVRNDTPLAMEWEIEIAQESTAMVPVVVQLPEGHELYLRYHPGERTTLVEVWSGTLEHLEVFDVDLSVIRNVPEASAPGKLQLPQTSAYRTYTVLAVPTDGASRRELSWDGPAGPVKLVLDLEPARRGPEPLVDQDSVCAVRRFGAAGAGLEFERRDGLADVLVDRMRESFIEDEDLMSVTEGVLYFRGSPQSVERIDAFLAREEARLKGERMRLRILRFSEASVRRALGAGRIAVGAEVVPEAMGSLSEEGGSVPGPSLTTPLLPHVPAHLRVGRSVTGLLGLDVEVAQQAGGTDPRTGVRFDGINGRARLLPRATGFRVDLHLNLEWANPEAGRIELVYRAPMSMYAERNEYPPKNPADDRVTLPALGGGRAVIARAVDLPDRGREVLGGVVVRGAEAHLLLVSLLP